MFWKISQYSQKQNQHRSLFLIKLQTSSLEFYFKRDSGTVVFLWVLQYENLYYRKPPGDYFPVFPSRKYSTIQLLSTSITDQAKYYVFIFVGFQFQKNLNLFLSLSLHLTIANIPTIRTIVPKRQHHFICTLAFYFNNI